MCVLFFTLTWAYNKDDDDDDDYNNMGLLLYKEKPQGGK